MDRRAELIFTGDELLLGDVINTNQAFLGERLLENGVAVTRAVCLTDDASEIVEVLRGALARSPVVLLLCGGLGPTEDDLTREAVAAALRRNLACREDLLEEIAARFQKLGLRMDESNRRQAHLPVGASPMPSPGGTAPGFWLVEGGTLLAALPGPPRELREMWHNSLAPVIRSHLSQVLPARQRRILVRRLRVYGIGESLLTDLLKDLPWHGPLVNIGTQASNEGITLTLRAQDSPEGIARLGEVEQHIRDMLGQRVYGTDEDDLASVVGDLLRQARLTVVTAESCTGGLVAKRLTDVPGSSDYFLGSIVAYSNALKTSLLGVPAALLEARGAVSEEVAVAMASGARTKMKADCAISVTGIAGPGGETPDKPVGLVYIATSIDEDVQVRRFTLFQTRDEIRARASQTALDLLRRRLLEYDIGRLTAQT